MASRRARPNPKSMKTGRITETYYDTYLANCGVYYHWNNEFYDKKIIDFHIELPDGDIAVEVEGKSKYYEEWYLHEGMDFQANKVEKFYDHEPEAWYAMLIYDVGYVYETMYTLPMKTILDNYSDEIEGENYTYKGKYEKYTHRGVKEWFYQVPLEDCIVVNISQE